MDWIKLFSALLIVAWLIFIWPQAKRWLREGRRAEAGDWPAAILPLLLVAGFVALLVMLV